MAAHVTHRKLPLIALIAISTIAGLMIPGFYDWTGADQSRPSPVVLPIASGILILAIAICASLPWIYPVTESQKRRARVQFGIRALLVATGLIGLLVAALRSPMADWVSGAVFVATLGLVIRACCKNPSLRLPTASLLSCLFLPYAWIFTWKSFSATTGEMLLFSGGLPSFLPTLFIGGLSGVHASNLGWLSMTLTSAILFCGVWLATRGPRRFLAFAIFAFLGSLYGSFILNALVRI